MSSTILCKKLKSRTNVFFFFLWITVNRSTGKYFKTDKYHQKYSVGVKYKPKGHINKLSYGQIRVFDIYYIIHRRELYQLSQWWINWNCDRQKHEQIRIRRVDTEEVLNFEYKGQKGTLGLWHLYYLQTFRMPVYGRGKRK